MGRLYAVTQHTVTITNAGGDADLMAIQPATDKPCEVHALFMDQISDVADAQEEMLAFKVIRGHTTGISGGALTEVPLGPNDVAASFAGTGFDASIATSGTPVDLHAGAFNIRAGIPLILPPELRWKVSAAETSLIVRMTTTVADDFTMSMTMIVEEF